MSFFKGYSIVMGANMIMLVLAFLNNKILYVFLDPASNGGYFLVIRITTLASIILGDWLRLSNMNLAGSDRNLNRVLLANSVWYSLLLGTGVVLLFHLASPFLPREIQGLSHGYILTALAAASLSILMGSLFAILLANQLLTQYALALVIWSTSILFLDFLFLVVFGFGLSAAIIAWIAGIGSAVLLVLYILISRDGCSLRPSTAIFRKSRSIGWKALIAISGMFLMGTAHVYVIQPIVGGREEALIMLAMLSVCFHVFQLLQRFVDVAGNLLMSRVVGQDVRASVQMTALTVRSIVLFSVAASLGVACLGRTIIPIIADTEYLTAYVPLLIMLPGVIAISTGSVLNGFYWGRGYPLRITLAPFVATGCGVALDYFLIPRMGLAGVTLSFSVMNILWMLYVTSAFSRDAGMSLLDVLLPRISDIQRFHREIQTVIGGSGMKVGVVSTVYPTRRYPVSGIFVKQQMDDLSRSIDIRLLAPIPINFWSGDAYSGTAPRGYPFLRPIIFPFPRWFMQSFYPVCLSWFLSRRKSFFDNCDLVHAHFAFPEAGAVVRAFGKRLPVVVTVHGTDVNRHAMHPPLRLGIIKALNTARTVICVSESLAITLRNIGVVSEMEVIPNGIDTALFTPGDRTASCRQLGLDPDRPRALFVGNFLPVKGIEFLIQALPRVLDRYPECELVLLGADPGKRNARKYIELAQRLGVERTMTVVERKPHDELPIWMRAADVFVLPSLREGFGIVAAEALACGTPVVATRSGGPEDIVRDGLGFLVPPRDPEALAHSILRALAREGIEKPEHLAEATGERFSRETVARRILAVYERACTAR